MKKLSLILALLLIPTACFAQQMSHRYFHYNQYYDAAAPFSIIATTSDGADSNAIYLAGGGAVADSRGAYILIKGNEAATGGDLHLNSGGGAAGDDIILTARNAASTIIMQPGASTRWTFGATGDLTQDATNGGDIIMAQTDEQFLIGQAAYTADQQSLLATPAIVSALRANGMMLQHGANSTAAPIMSFVKSRATDGTADTVVNSGDYLGEIDFAGSDGAAYRLAAYITARVDGTPGGSDMPGRLEFYVTPDGSATPAEAMRISQNKLVTVTTGIMYATGTDLPDAPVAGSTYYDTNDNACDDANASDGTALCWYTGAAWLLVAGS